MLPAFRLQVIDFTNQDASWAIGSLKWGTAQQQPGWTFAYRTAPSPTAWTYTITTNPAVSKNNRPLTIALFGDWATGGDQVRLGNRR